MAFDDPIIVIAVISIIIAAIIIVSYAVYKIFLLFRKTNRVLDEESAKVQKRPKRAQ